MATLPSLSENKISDFVVKGELPPPGSVFQVLGTRKLKEDKTDLKYRLCLSDGVNRFSQCLLHYLKPDQSPPPENSLIRIKDNGERDVEVDRANTIIHVDNKIVWVVGNFDVIAVGGSDVKNRLGNPVPLNAAIERSPIVDATTTPKTPANEPISHASTPPPVPLKRRHDEDASEDGANSSSGKFKMVKRALFNEVSTPLRATQTIASLSQFTNKFTIKARVTKKSDVRTWNNSRGSGQVFDVILQDASGDIKCVAFGSEAQRLSSIFQENRVYYVSQARVKTSNPQFNPTKHSYELLFTASSEVIEARDATDVPGLQFSYTQIVDIAHKNENELVDVIGICTGVEDLRDITVKSSGRQIKKLDFHLTDTSDAKITTTLWDKKGEEFAKTENLIGRVVRIKKAKVSDFSGKSLNIGFQGSVEVDPEDCPESEALLDWWSRRSASSDFSPEQLSGSTQSASAKVTQFSTLKEIHDDFRFVNPADPARYHRFEGYVVDIKADTVMYPACPSCNKKVVDLSDGNYRCEKCAQTLSNFNWRYILRAAIADTTEYQWVTFFDDTARALVGMTANELRNIFDQDPNVYRKKLHQVKYGMFEFASKTKCEKYNDETRIKMSIISVAPILNHAQPERLQRLRDEIESMKLEIWNAN